MDQSVAYWKEGACGFIPGLPSGLSYPIGDCDPCNKTVVRDTRIFYLLSPSDQISVPSFFSDYAISGMIDTRIDLSRAPESRLFVFLSYRELNESIFLSSPHLVKNISYTLPAYFSIGGK